VCVCSTVCRETNFRRRRRPSFFRRKLIIIYAKNAAGGETTGFQLSIRSRSREAGDVSPNCCHAAIVDDNIVL